jgi:LPS O-antigen subunit length determinant protein (WzzB/FepE family)
VYSTPPPERRPTPKRYYFLMALVYALLIGVILGVGFVLLNTLSAR